MPKPTASLKMYEQTLDGSGRYRYRLTPAFLLESKPLLVPCDLSMPIE